VADFTLQVDGLDEAVKGLARADRELANELVKQLRLEAKDIAMQVRRMPAQHPASPSSRQWVFWKANRKGAWIVLRGGKADGRGIMEEFGAHQAQVGFEENVPRSQQWFKGRVTQPWNRDGYYIQPTIRRNMPQFVKRLTAILGGTLGEAVRRGY
jgi:hypothetical protein